MLLTRPVDDNSWCHPLCPMSNLAWFEILRNPIKTLDICGFGCKKSKAQLPIQKGIIPGNRKTRSHGFSSGTMAGVLYRVSGCSPYIR